MEANNYIQVYVHCIFAVKYRHALIGPAWEESLHQYITGIAQNNGHKMLAINSVPDHLHLFLGLNPNQSISEIMRLIKGDSSEFVNKQHYTNTKFHWQRGYGAFTNSRSQIDGVVKYIMKQKEHHHQTAFREEYIAILNEYGVSFNEKYIFQDPIDG